MSNVILGRPVGGTTEFIVPRNPTDKLHDGAYPIRSTLNILQDDFSGTSLSDLWEVGTTGTSPPSYAVNNGLTVQLGTAGNNGLTLTSRKVFHLPARFSIGFAISQRIGANFVKVELVSCSGVDNAVDTDYPAYAGYQWSGASSTATVINHTAGGGTAISNTTQTALTTSTAAIYELALGEEDMVTGYRDLNGARRYQTMRHANLPRLDRCYRLRLSFLNSGVPASDTAVTISHVVVRDYNDTMARLVTAEGNVATATALLVSGEITLSSTKPTYGTANTTAVAAGGSQVTTSIDNGSSNGRTTFVVNAFMNRNGTLTAEGSADNTTFYVVASTPVTATVGASLSVPMALRYWRARLSNTDGTASTSQMIMTGTQSV